MYLTKERKVFNMMGDKKNKKWNVSMEAKALGENLKTLRPGDNGYDDTLAAIEKCSKINESKWVMVSTVFKNIATVIICAGVGFLAYSIDQSNEIPRNKLTKELFHKIFKGS